LNNNADISPGDLDIIERYLAQEMSVRDREHFENRLLADPQLKEHTEEIRLIRLAVREQALRDKMSRFHDNTVIDVAPAPAAKIISWRTWLSVAALFLFLAAAGWWLLLRPAKETQLFARYYQPDPGLMTTMGGTDQYEFNRAMIDYKTGSYDLAIARWKQQLAGNVQSDTLRYLIASAHLAHKEYDKALPLFEQVISDKSSVFAPEAYWYAGLAALKLNKKQLAIQYLSLSGRSEKDEIVSELK
jgi:tetratricopeptide (TPR) repeat protein